MRIISLVPSWTESLLLAGANIVGRTRFCVHPRELVASIPVVGGTKSIDWEIVRALKPDLLVLDREENPKQFAQNSPCDYVATHVLSLENAREGTEKLWQATGIKALKLETERWRRVLEKGPRDIDIKALPEVQCWLREPKRSPKRLHYVIWQDPWMGVSRGTFIASLFDYFGWGELIAEAPVRYPKLPLSARNDADALCLFATEPFPFTSEKLVPLNLQAGGLGIINGEAYSWFGCRSLRMLESIL